MIGVPKQLLKKKYIQCGLMMKGITNPSHINELFLFFLQPFTLPLNHCTFLPQWFIASRCCSSYQGRTSPMKRPTPLLNNASCGSHRCRIHLYHGTCATMSIFLPTGMWGWPLLLEDLTSTSLRGKLMYCLTKAFSGLPLVCVAIATTKVNNKLFHFSTFRTGLCNHDIP